MGDDPCEKQTSRLHDTLERCCKMRLFFDLSCKLSDIEALQKFEHETTQNCATKNTVSDGKAANHGEWDVEQVREAGQQEKRPARRREKDIYLWQEEKQMVVPFSLHRERQV